MADSCSHDIVFSDLCALCGKSMNQGSLFSESETKGFVQVVGRGVTTLKLKVAPAVAVHAGAVNSRILRESNRLALVVDLDKTVLHTTRRPFFEHWMHDNVSDIFEVNGSVLDDISLMLGQYSFPNDPHTYFTKMRPHAREALEQLSQHFELHVYTMGKRRYATEVLGFLDPDKKLFGDRIMTQDETFDINSKTQNLEALFPDGDYMVAIIDDSDEIWNHRANLVKVVPYTYFKGSDDVNVNFAHRAKAEVDQYTEKIQRLCHFSEAIDIPVAVTSILTEKHGSKLGNTMSWVLECETRRLYQWEAKNIVESIEGIPWLYAELNENEQESMHLAFKELTAVVHQPIQREASYFAVQLKHAIDTVNILFSSVVFQRNKGAAVTVEMTLHTNVPAPVVQLVLYHIGCLRGTAFDESTGRIKASLPPQFDSIFRAKTKSDVSAQVRDRLQRFDFVSAVLYFRAVNSLVPKLTLAEGGKDEFTVLKSFLSLLRHEPHALPWPRPTHDEDSILPQVAVILERIHSEFYGHPNSKNNVAHIVRKIYPEFRTYPPWLFKGLRFCFSQIIPRDKRPETHVQWQRALYYGAECHHDLSPEVTHLITSGLTEKVKQAQSQRRNIRIVTLEWVDSCIAQGALLPEVDFAPFGLSHQPAVPKHAADSDEDESRIKRGRGNVGDALNQEEDDDSSTTDDENYDDNDDDDEILRQRMLREPKSASCCDDADDDDADEDNGEWDSDEDLRMLKAAIAQSGSESDKSGSDEEENYEEDDDRDHDDDDDDQDDF